MPYMRDSGRGLGVTLPPNMAWAQPRLNALPHTIANPLVRAPIVNPNAPIAVSTPAGYTPGTIVPVSSAATLPTVTPVAPGGSTPVAQPAQTGVVATTSPSGSTSTTCVAGPPPGSYPTDEAYTDCAGNIWTFTPTGWQISTAAGTSTSSTSSTLSGITSWLQSSTLISALPNYWTIAIGGVAAIVAWKMLTGGSHRRHYRNPSPGSLADLKKALGLKPWESVPKRKRQEIATHGRRRGSKYYEERS